MKKTPEGFDHESFKYMIGSMMAHVQHHGHVTLQPEALLELMQESSKLIIRSTILDHLENKYPRAIAKMREEVRKEFGIESFEALDEPVEKPRIITLN